MIKHRPNTAKKNISIDSSLTETQRIAALEAALEAYGLVVDTA